MKRPSLMPIADPALKRVLTDILNEMEAGFDRLSKVVNDQGVFIGELPANVVTGLSFAESVIDEFQTVAMGSTLDDDGWDELT